SLNNEKLAIKSSPVGNLTGSESILVVDDERALLDLTRDILSLHGFNVICAESAKDALYILERESIDILISDVIMPEVDGYQLAAMVKEKYPDIKIQLVSGFDGERNTSTIDKSLQYNLLHKPMNSKTLLKRIRKLCEENV
ncbi:MAG: DNA-binding NtrC family response regulator, partial [Enterobacterales bacterium]